jgi:hypothetical protein
MIQNLKPEYLQRIKEDQELQAKIAKLFNRRNIITVQRWVDAKNPILTIPAVLRTIREHLLLSQTVDLLEKPERVRA